MNTGNSGDLVYSKMDTVPKYSIFVFGESFCVSRTPRRMIPKIRDFIKKYPNKSETEKQNELDRVMGAVNGLLDRLKFQHRTEVEEKWEIRRWETMVVSNGGTAKKKYTKSGDYEYKKQWMKKQKEEQGDDWVE